MFFNYIPLSNISQVLSSAILYHHLHGTTITSNTTATMSTTFVLPFNSKHLLNQERTYEMVKVFRCIYLNVVLQFSFHDLQMFIRVLRIPPSPSPPPPTYPTLTAPVLSVRCIINPRLWP